MSTAPPPTGPSERLVVVGGGLAGCEAAVQAARQGRDVLLYEMKPQRFSPAHRSQHFAELVCSNSLRGAGLGNAVGLLKEEMRRLGSLVIEAADATAVPAGRALAVDREAFSKHVTRAVETHPRIEVRRELVAALPEAPVAILATGPLTGSELAADLQRVVGAESLYFYDAIAPTVYADSIDRDVVFRASRWQQDAEGEGDYLNVPLSREEYEAFVAELVAADTVPLHPFEAALYFEGCLPVEEMARRGPRTLAFGPMKPVGLSDPRTGRRPHAVVQLRQEDRDGVLCGLVGFQTKLRIGEQQRILRSLPGLSGAVFARYGSVHRNTYLDAPRQLQPSLELVARPGLFVAGQMAGVEGYVESAALGFLAAMHACRRLAGEPLVAPPRETAHGALLAHLANDAARDFQPSNVTYGHFPPVVAPVAPPPARDARPRRGRRGERKRARNEALAERALAALVPYCEQVEAWRA